MQPWRCPAWIPAVVFDPGARERPRRRAQSRWGSRPLRQIAGMVFVEVPPPFPNPPADLVAETQCNAPGNIESRDYLQVERDAWEARRKIGDIPVTVISNRYSPGEVAAAPPVERPLVRANVELQRGWLVLSPQAKQVAVHIGHAVEESAPELVIDAILAVVGDARA